MAHSVSQDRRNARARRHFRLRKKVTGTATRPRLVVNRSTRHIAVQLVDDSLGHTLVSASTLEADLRSGWEKGYGASGLAWDKARGAVRDAFDPKSGR